MLQLEKTGNESLYQIQHHLLFPFMCPAVITGLFWEGLYLTEIEETLDFLVSCSTRSFSLLGPSAPGTAVSVCCHLSFSLFITCCFLMGLSLSTEN